MDVRILKQESLTRSLLDQVIQRIKAKRSGGTIPQPALPSTVLRDKIDKKSYFILRKNDPNNQVEDVEFREVRSDRLEDSQG